MSVHSRGSHRCLPASGLPPTVRPPGSCYWRCEKCLTVAGKAMQNLKSDRRPQNSSFCKFPLWWAKWLRILNPMCTFPALLPVRCRRRRAHRWVAGLKALPCVSSTPTNSKDSKRALYQTAPGWTESTLQLHLEQNHVILRMVNISSFCCLKLQMLTFHPRKMNENVSQGRITHHYK